MVTITFLEQPSEKTLLLSWREPGCCNYTEQLWSLRKAQIAGTCVVSGKEILRGETVYAPVAQVGNSSHRIRRDAVPKHGADNSAASSLARFVRDIATLSGAGWNRRSA